MTSRLLLFLIALQLLAGAGLARLMMALWPAMPAWQAAALALLAVLLVRFWITLQNFALSYCYRSQTPPLFRSGWPARARLLGAEFIATLLVSSWHMVRPGPVRWPPAGAAATAGPAAPPVLLVHGYGCNRGYWRPLSRRLAQAGIVHRALDLEPAVASIDMLVPQLAAAIERLCPEPGDRVILVAHSMGGLVGRAYLRTFGAARVVRLITLATPHHGTVLARFGPGASARQMGRAGAGRQAAPSAWLAALAGAETAQQRALVTSLFSHHDNIVAPQTSAWLEGARNIAFGGLGHVSMGRAPQVLRCVVAEIRAAQAGSPPAVPQSVSFPRTRRDDCCGGAIDTGPSRR